MADGAVPSVAPESVAESILRLATGANNPGVLFTNAFFKGAELNRRQQQLEQQLAIAQMKNYTDQVYHQNQLSNGQTQAAIKIQALELQNHWKDIAAQNAADKIDVAAQAVDVNRQKQEFKNMQDQRLMDDTSQFLNDWQGQDVSPGQSDYWTKLAETMQRHPAFAQSKAGLQWQKNSGDQHTLAANRAVAANNAMWSGFEKETKDKYFSGAYADYSIFEHPEWWQQQWVDKNGAPVGAQVKRDEKGNIVPLAKGDPGYVEGAKKSENVFYDRGPQYALPTNPAARYITQPATVVQTDTNRYRKLIEDRTRIG